MLGTSRHSPHLFVRLAESLREGRQVALTTVVQATGSTPQRVGAHLIVAADGRFEGTLGGGMVEAEALRRAVASLQTRLTEVFDFSLNAPYSREAGPICGGAMRIFIDPTLSDGPENVYAVADALAARERGVAVFHVASGLGPGESLSWIPEAGVETIQDDTFRQELKASLSAEQPRKWASSDGSELLLEPIAPQPRLIVVGGGHCGQAIAHCGAWVGFDIHVIEDREEFARPELFPEDAHIACGNVRELVRNCPLGQDAYLVLVTRGHRSDAEALEECIHRDAAYKGMIGSRRKVAELRKHFLDTRLASDEEWAQLFTPIGLDIGAITVPEIAVSVLAQIIAVRRKGVQNLTESLKWPK